MRSLSSSAALFVNVMAMMRHGSTGSTAAALRARRRSSGVRSVRFVRVRAAAVLNEICDPVDEHRGFTAAGSGQQQQWAFRCQNRLSLHIVQVREVRRDEASARLHIPLFKSQCCSIHSV